MKLKAVNSHWPPTRNWIAGSAFSSWTRERITELQLARAGQTVNQGRIICKGCFSSLFVGMPKLHTIRRF
jgi:hypothetical protein